MKLASSRDTSNGPDWKDVTQAIINYELLWGCRICLNIHVDGFHGRQFLLVEGMAVQTPDSPGGLLHSVSVSASMRSLNVTTLEAAFLAVLHKLDREVEVATPMGS